MNAAAPSPTKRRALGALDANALSSPRQPATGKTALKQVSPIKKRPIEASTISPRPQKKTCVEEDNAARSRSASPDTSSLFDNNDASWASITTPDVSPAPRVLTREQAREKAEILKLRLGLASYKVRTGQTSVPLSELVVKPLPPRRRAPSKDAAEHEEPQQQKGESPRKDNDNGVEEEEDKDKDEHEHHVPPPELPKLRRCEATPRGKQIVRAEEEELRLTSSALRGGAASGLLSLARGGSAE